MFYKYDYLNISKFIKAGGRSKIPVTTTVLTYTPLINHANKVTEILHTDWLLQATIFDLLSSGNTSKQKTKQQHEICFHIFVGLGIF